MTGLGTRASKTGGQGAFPVLTPSKGDKVDTTVTAEMPAAEAWGRVAMLMDRTFPKGRLGDKLLALWPMNPAMALATAHRHVRWTAASAADKDVVSALLASAGAPPARPLTPAEQGHFLMGMIAEGYPRL
ncbi:hypothetical protein GCM10017673_38130 [Streptosporangium violaceochromogenes]|nr:hypothetical protein GCM10017673_38130 [Streptosporangium violaceochromogenes]